MKRICVFCGSSRGVRPEYAEAAAAIGEELTTRGMGLVYGGGSVGLMGALADEVLKMNGEAVGVIPRALWEKEVGHGKLTELHVVESMHERKALMARLADGFVVLPGGIGTLEEMFEIWTWGQLGLHKKPLGLLDVGGFFDPLEVFLERMVAEGFLKGVHRNMILRDADAGSLLDRMASYDPPSVSKWIGLAQS